MRRSASAPTRASSRGPIHASSCARKTPDAPLRLTTPSESPAGAGIAGSSALNVAVCAAFADWSRRHFEPEALLQVAMNIEAQVINVPTGLQDYRPALYG